MSKESASHSEYCHRVYMRFPGVPRAYCELECCLDQKNASPMASFQRVATGRLGYNIGLRNGDILSSINLTNMDGVSAASIIETLQWLSVNRPILIGIKRIRQGQDEFWWFLIKLVIKNGKPAVDVISSLCNASGDIPDFGRDYQEVNLYTYLPPPEKVNIIQPISQLYLSVQIGKLEFQTYNRSASMFNMYKYSGSIPSSGVPCALVHMPLDSEGESDSCIETISPDGQVQLDLTNFPPFMTGERPISSNGRFFFLKGSSGGAYHLFESETESGYCITHNPANQEAVAVKPPTEFSDMNVDFQGPVSKI